MYCHEEKSTNAIPSEVKILLSSWVRKLPEGEWTKRGGNEERGIQVKEEEENASERSWNEG